MKGVKKEALKLESIIENTSFTYCIEKKHKDAD